MQEGKRERKEEATEEPVKGTMYGTKAKWELCLPRLSPPRAGS